MIRRLDGEQPAFLLETVNSTYAFQVLPTGHLEQLYYGPRIPLETREQLAPLTEKRSFPPGAVISYDEEHKVLAPEDLCLEMSGPGKGDIREPFVELVHADGSRTCDFLFESAEITGEKPPFRTLPGSYAENGHVDHLTVFLRDRSYGLTLELHYFVYPECDCICRSAKLLNTSGEPVELPLPHLHRHGLRCPRPGLYALLDGPELLSEYSLHQGDRLPERSLFPGLPALPEKPPLQPLRVGAHQLRGLPEAELQCF